MSRTSKCHTLSFAHWLSMIILENQEFTAFAMRKYSSDFNINKQDASMNYERVSKSHSDNIKITFRQVKPK